MERAAHFFQQSQPESLDQLDAFPPLPAGALPPQSGQATPLSIEAAPPPSSQVSHGEGDDAASIAESDISTSGATASEAGTSAVATTLGDDKEFHCDLPVLIGKAAALLGVPGLEEDVDQGLPLWNLVRYGQPTKRKPRLLPAMPGIEVWVRQGWEAPTSIRTPLRAHVAATRVVGWSGGLSSAPPLEPELAAVLVPGAMAWGSAKRPTMPSPKDRTTMSLAEKSFELAAQGVAAASSIALLACPPWCSMTATLPLSLSART